MRIAMLSRGYGKTAGIWRVTTDLTENFLARGHEVTYFCADPPTPNHPGLELVGVPVPARPFALRVPLFARRASRLARRTSRTRAGGPFDVIHGQATDCYGADVVTAHSCHRYGMDLMRRTGGAWERFKKTVNPIHPAIYRLERHNVSPAGARRVIAVSAGIKREIVATYRTPPERIHVVANGVDLATFDPARRAARRARVRQRWRLGDAPVLLFVGYEYVRKGLRFVLDAMTRMRRGDARLVVIGKPPTPHARRLLARYRLGPRVLFTGPVPDVEAYYAAADAFVFPTLYEAFGLVIAEAMATGLPVLTTRVAGAAEWMTDGEDGFLFGSPPDPAAMARVLDRLCEDQALARRIGASARATAERCWSTARVAGEVLAVYEEVIDERAREAAAGAGDRALDDPRPPA